MGMRETRPAAGRTVVELGLPVCRRGDHPERPADASGILRGTVPNAPRTAGAVHHRSDPARRRTGVVAAAGGHRRRPRRPAGVSAVRGRRRAGFGGNWPRRQLGTAPRGGALRSGVLRTGGGHDDRGGGPPARVVGRSRSAACRSPVACGTAGSESSRNPLTAVVCDPERRREAAFAGSARADGDPGRGTAVCRRTGRRRCRFAGRCLRRPSSLRPRSAVFSPS